MPQITQLFFDCDNTLVVTEDIAFETTAGLVNELLAEYGISDRYTTDSLLEFFMGQTFRAMMTTLQSKYHFEMTAERRQDYVRKEEVLVMSNLRAKGRPCTGSMEVLQTLVESNKYSMGVVSSSALRRIRASLEITGQDNYFPHSNVFSAMTSLDPPKTKPDPAVYLHAMKTLGVTPEQCVTVEDSVSGARSAIRAGIPCIAYVGCYHTRQKQEEIARTLKAMGCCAVMYDWNEFIGVLKGIEMA